jgi:hypothetical protein
VERLAHGGCADLAQHGARIREARLPHGSGQKEAGDISLPPLGAPFALPDRPFALRIRDHAVSPAAGSLICWRKRSPGAVREIRL